MVANIDARRTDRVAPRPTEPPQGGFLLPKAVLMNYHKMLNWCLTFIKQSAILSLVRQQTELTRGRTMKRTAKPAKMIMTAYNATTRKYEAVDPEGEIAGLNLIPMFWCAGEQKYMTVPGVTAADVYGEWIRQ